MADQQKKFSLEKAVAGNKRALETPEQVRKIPKVSQMATNWDDELGRRVGTTSAVGALSG